MNFNKRNILGTLLGFSIAIGLGSCEKTEIEENPVNISVIFATQGLGDHSVEDGVYSAVKRIELMAENDSIADVVMNVHFPNTMEQAQRLCEDWLATYSQENRRLLVLAGNSFDSLLTSNPSLRNKGKSEILAIDSYDDTKDIHTLGFDMYGLYAQGAGLIGKWAQAVSGWGIPDKRFQPGKVAVVCANPFDGPVVKARDGMIETLDTYGIDSHVFYLSQQPHQGYDMQDSLFRLCAVIDSLNYGFAVPVCAASQIGMISYSRIAMNKATFIICNMDEPLFTLSNDIAFSLTRDISSAVFEELNLWIEGRKTVKHRTITKDEGYMSLDIPQAYKVYLDPFL